MKKFIMCAIVAVTFAVPALSATPADARVFCYNLVTGQFSHWGYCRVLCTPLHTVVTPAARLLGDGETAA